MIDKITTKLSTYPKTLAFIAVSATYIKGGDVKLWLRELENYEIIGKCSCGQCYTIYLQAPDGQKGSFSRDGVYAHFGETIVIIHEDENGNLKEFEMPDRCVVTPFSDEYEELANIDYVSPLSLIDGLEAAKKWFEMNKETEAIVVVVE